MTAANILSRYQQVKAQISQALSDSNRADQPVSLLAVSKTKPAEQVEALYHAGQRDFGENYVQEAVEKVETLKDLAITWHFIGPIQSNKTRLIANHFAWVHSIDRLKIAKRLSEQRDPSLPALNICIQVNISGEASKSGCHPDELDELLSACAQLPNLCVRGLMAIPAASPDTEQTETAFCHMQQLFTQCQAQHSSIDTLSMGMSSDMNMAIANGSTMIRIGTALFGARPPKP